MGTLFRLICNLSDGLSAFGEMRVLVSGISMKRLFAAASAPLFFAASTALAQTTISTNSTTPVATSTSGDLLVNSGAGVTVRTGGPAVTIDSNNTVTNNGTISVRNSTTGGTGILVTTGAGRTTTISNAGDIAADDNVVLTDTDGDGDLDGPYATPGMVRYGIRTTGAGALTGNVSTTFGSVISVVGDSGSTSVSIESPMVGNVVLKGTLGALGDNSYALHTTETITGDLSIGGVLNVQGLNSSSVAIDGAVTGQVRIDGNLSTSGFRYLKRSDAPKGIELLDADDLLIGGPAIRINASASRGVVLDAPPPITDATDANGDGVPDNTDQDADGIPDAQETTGIVNSYGSSPGLLAGGASAIILGNAGTASRDVFGLIIRGILSSNGVYDGVSATGVQVAGLGGAVNTTGGMSVTGQVNAAAFNAGATGIRLGSGAVVPVLNVNRGLISSGVQTVAGTVVDARAVQIDAGASLSTLNNAGTIKAGLNGPAGNATAVLDNAGLLSVINNTNTIQATVISTDKTVTAVGNAIALDLRANTTGVTLNQTQNAVEGIDSIILGDILLSDGAFNDTVAIGAGATKGVISFGGGTDALSISGGSLLTGGLRKGSGSLAVDVAAGTLDLNRTNSTNLSSLNVGATSILTLTTDPTNADPLQRISSLNVAGQATFEEGSQIKLKFLHKLLADGTFTVVSAGTLVNNGVTASLAEQLPALFNGQLTVGVNSITIAARRRTASELGLVGARADAFEAFYKAFDSDTDVANDILSKTTDASFGKIYSQFLPDYSGGAFKALSGTTRETMRAQAESPVGLPHDQPRSWLQEVGATVKQETINEVPYQTGGFGLVGGYERPIGNDGYIGVSGSYMTSEIRNQIRFTGSHLAASAVTAGAYWRQPMQNLTLDADVTGGLAWFDSSRKIVDATSAGAQLLVRQADGKWTGALAAARFGATYDATFNVPVGTLYVRPSAEIDGVYLSEGGYTETGGGSAVNLNVASRTNYEAAAQVGVVVGGLFGRAYRWGPEFEIGYRTILANGDGQTTASYASVAGTSFTLGGLDREKGLLIVRAALRGQGAYSNLAFEAGGEIGSNYEAYTARFVVRFVF